MIESIHSPDRLIMLIYGIILLYFVLGGIGFYVINRNKPREQARKSYIKFTTYFVIIHIFFGCIALLPGLFRYLAIALILGGGFEMGRLWVRSGFGYIRFYAISVVIYLILGLGFVLFSTLPAHYVLYVFLIVSIFDSFSQISGQLWGHTKITPVISPNKTLGGVTGGVIVAFVSAFLLKDLFETEILERLWLAGGVIGLAFVGDLLASFFKRKYEVKDYSRLIPGHGGILDRFDSLIAAGAWAALYMCF